MKKFANNRKRELIYFNRLVETEKKYSKAGGIETDINISQWWSNHLKYVVDWQLGMDDKKLTAKNSVV